MLQYLKSVGRIIKSWTPLLLATLLLTACGSRNIESLNSVIARPNATFRPEVIREHNLNSVVDKAVKHSVHIGVFPTESRKNLNAFGSGYIISKTGLVLTAAHVATDFENDNKKAFLMCKLPTGEKYNAVILNVDVKNDLALLYVPEFDGVGFEDSEIASPAIRKGKPIKAFAVGAPRLKTFPFISYGIVFDSNTRELVHRVYIDHGSSGGPLLDLQGRLIGINVGGNGTSLPKQPTRLYEGFAIRGDLILKFLDESKEAINNIRK